MLCRWDGRRGGGVVRGWSGSSVWVGGVTGVDGVVVLSARSGLLGPGRSVFCSVRVGLGLLGFALCPVARSGVRPVSFVAFRSVGLGGFEVVFAGFGVFVDLPVVVVDFVVAVIAYQHQVVYVGGSVL